MNYTKNNRLPQWVKEDRIMMDDFNAMNSSIESGMTKTAAQASAARADAAQAKQTAGNAFSMDYKPYATGHYTGTGADQIINVGFRPSFAIVSAQGEAPQVGTTGSGVYALLGFSGGNALTGKIDFTDTGIICRKERSEGSYYPHLTYPGRVYDYILFR